GRVPTSLMLSLLRGVAAPTLRRVGHPVLYGSERSLDERGRGTLEVMSLVFDTASLEPGERFEGWQDAAARCFFPMAIRRRTVEPFAGRMIGFELPSIDVVRVTA